MKFESKADDSGGSAQGARSKSESAEQLKYIKSFDELFALGAEGLDGQEITFQPVGRYNEGRQKGNVRVWEGHPDLINIEFMGSKGGVLCPDAERITRENFDERKDILKIQPTNL